MSLAFTQVYFTAIQWSTLNQVSAPPSNDVIPVVKQIPTSTYAHTHSEQLKNLDKLQKVAKIKCLEGLHQAPSLARWIV